MLLGPFSFMVVAMIPFPSKHPPAPLWGFSQRVLQLMSNYVATELVLLCDTSLVCSVHRLAMLHWWMWLHVLLTLRPITIQRLQITESALILIRHGESMWNEKNLFTGCVDVPLTQRGIEEAIEAGKQISNIPVDIIHTSTLIRAQMTAMLALTQHRQKKVPIIMHDESKQAKEWGQIASEETKKQSIPVIIAWKLNERMYGELQGLNKQETAERYGKEKAHEWHRSYDIPPPNGESLQMCSQRAVSYFRDYIIFFVYSCNPLKASLDTTVKLLRGDLEVTGSRVEPQLQAGKNVLVAAHGNSLRSIIMYLDGLTSQEVINLELSTGIPLLYIYKDGKFMKRGSPVGPTEAGVYAYTRRLALYRQELDKMLQ